MSQPGVFSAVLAGLLSFLSPCVLPLVPAYISFISGASVAEPSSRKSRSAIFLRSLAFSAGFTAAFTILGIVFSGSAMFVGRAGASRYIDIASGIIVVLLGLNTLFDFIKFLGADTRLIGKFTGKKATGPFGAFLLGLAFAAGWSPCIGPLLASILLFASREGNLARSVILLIAYSLGFAVPFLASGLFFDRLKPVIAFFRKHANGVRIVSGIVLILFGITMAAGNLNAISSLAARIGYGIEDFAAAKPGATHAIGIAVYLLIALAVLSPLFAGRKKPRTRSRLSTIRISILALVAGLSVAELLGALSLVSGAAKWLTFTGF